ncbi:MAG TPA: hypothetical protein PKE47_16265, partial [Verrucomicrobiota bacterium]|nr:hypothetical protein [Verrucomicrobiota bacterium]
MRIARPDDREEFYALWEAGIQAQLGEGIVRTRGEARQLLTPLRPPTAAELRRHGRIYHVGTEPSGENILDLEAPLPSAFADGFHDVEERHVLESVTSPVSVEPVSASPEALLLFRLNQRAARAVLENAVRSYGRDGGVLVPVRAPTRRETVENARVERPGDGGLAARMALPPLLRGAYLPTAIR